MGGEKRASDYVGLSAIASIETAAADPDSWRADAEHRQLKRKVIKLLQKPSEATAPSAPLDVKAKRSEIRRLIKAAKAEAGIEGSRSIIINITGLTIYCGAESPVVAKRRRLKQTYTSTKAHLMNLIRQAENDVRRTNPKAES
jgi:hypothetical protein